MGYIEEIFGLSESVLEKINGFNGLRGKSTAFSFRLTQSNVCDKVFVYEKSDTTRGGKYNVKKPMTLGALPHYLEKVTQTSFGAIKKEE